jgi:BirA family biotin operon repressor/biotin-[acetyl-CoA-carboxylase] ligase
MGYNREMELSTLQSRLSALPLGQIAYFDVLDSTNEYALHWAKGGAQNLSLVVADEQTAGRGRSGRTWFTPPGAALAFSLVIKPEELEMGSVQITLLTGLGALSVCQVLQKKYGLKAEIKWPNDVLVAGRKLAGVLAELSWQGEALESAVLGIGINVAQDSVPPKSELNFPATCVETALGSPVDRWNLLKEILEGTLDWLPHLDQAEFLQAWEGNLAYQMDLVQLLFEEAEPVEGRLLGLGSDGSLRLELPDGEIRSFQAGEVHLRVVDR